MADRALATSPRIAVVAAGSARGELGGAERFYLGLTNALCAIGYKAELINVVSDEATFDSIKASYLRFYDLDMTAFDGVISTKAPSYALRHPNHVCYLVHTMRVFYDMFDVEFPNAPAQLQAQRDFIQRLDTGCLQAPRTRKILSIGEEVTARLTSYNNLDAEVLHPTTTLSGFQTGTYDYIFAPGRLHRWKRVDLAINAMRHVRRPVKLLISGDGEDSAYFHNLAGTDDRILFVGRVSDQRLLELYSKALAVLFAPLREDLGLITFEAFLSEKPVITCIDSGEPARIVQNGKTGFVCAADPQDIAKQIEFLFDNPDQARRMGKMGYQSIAHLSWHRVARRLGEALGFAATPAQKEV